MDIVITIFWVIAFFIFALFWGINDLTNKKKESDIPPKILHVLKENSPIDWEKAKRISEEYGYKPSVIIQYAVRSNEVEYKKKERVKL